MLSTSWWFLTGELCYCMYNYMNQGDWLVDVCPKCFVKCNKVTLELSGKPDPTWDPTKVDTSLDRPLEKLQAVLAQFKNKADLTGLVCKTRSEVDSCGCIHVMLECPLHGDKRCKGNRGNIKKMNRTIR